MKTLQEKSLVTGAAYFLIIYQVFKWWIRKPGARQSWIPQRGTTACGQAGVSWPQGRYLCPSYKLPHFPERRKIQWETKMGEWPEDRKKKKKKDQQINNISDTGAYPRRNFHSICSLKHFLSGSDDLGSRVKTGFLNP